MILVGLFGLLIRAQAQGTGSTNKDEIRQYKLSALQSQYEGDKNTAGHYLNKIAFVYWEKQDLEKAAHYFEQSLRLSVASTNDMATAMIGSNLASIYQQAGEYDKSIKQLENTTKIYAKLRKKSEEARTYVNLGKVYQNAKKHQFSVEAYEKGLRIANTINEQMLISTCYEGLAESYEKLGNHSKSAQYYKKYAHSARSAPGYGLHSYDRAKVEEAELWIRTMEKEKRTREQQLQEALSAVRNISEEKGEIELVKDEQAGKIALLEQDKLVKDLALKEHELKLQNHRIIIYLGTLGVASVILVTVILYFNYRNTKKSRKQLEVRNTEILRQNEEIESQKMELQGLFGVLEEKNLKITGSINYAKRIQDAILPNDADFKQALPQSFIFYKPRDIVSGDFYWINEKDFKPVFTTKYVGSEEMSILKGFESEKVIVTAVDCTGHGVPGAFMSMIGVNLLNEIVTVRNVSEPDKILNELHKGIRKALHQKETANRDGMDIAVCCHDKKNKVLEYSGAKNPLIYIQDGKLNLLRADRKTIGGMQREKQRLFKKQIIPLTSPVTAYIFSDGYQDQFGGPQGKKFTQKRMRDIFQRIYDKPFDKQHEILEETLENWQGKEERIDDILILGFRVE